LLQRGYSCGSHSPLISRQSSISRARSGPASRWAQKCIIRIGWDPTSPLAIALSRRLPKARVREPSTLETVETGGDGVLYLAFLFEVGPLVLTTPLGDGVMRL